MLLPFVDVNMEPENYPIDGFVFGVEGAVANGAIPVRVQLANGFFTRDFNNAVFESGKVYYFQVSHPVVKPNIELIRVRWDDNGNRHVLTPDEDPDSVTSGGTGNSPFPITLVTPVVVGDTIVTVFNAARNRYEGRNAPAPTFASVTAKGNVTTADIQANNYQLPARAPANEGRGVAVLLPTNNGASLAVVEMEFLRLAEKLNLNLDYLFETFFARRDLRFLDQKGIANGTGERLWFNNRALQFTGETFQSGAASIFKSYSSFDLSPVTAPTPGFYVPQQNPDNLTWEFRYLTNQQAAQQLAPALRPLLLGTDIEGDTRMVDAVFCVDVAAPAVAGQPYRARITPAMIGVAQTHGLNAAKPDLILLFQNSTDDADTVMVLTFPTLNTYLISYPAELTTGYEGGKLRLELI